MNRVKYHFWLIASVSLWKFIVEVVHLEAICFFVPVL